MEIEVGDYVRTRDGIIAKAKKKVNYIVELETTTGETRHYIIEEISKHSKNIIDLIEVGDFVNGYKVLDVVKTSSTDKLLILISQDGEKNTFILLRNDNVKTILTHEQYEQNCFRMEE